MVKYRTDVLANGDLKPGETILVCGGDGAGGMGCITSTFLDRLIAWYVGADEIEQCLQKKSLSCLPDLALSAVESVEEGEKGVPEGLDPTLLRSDGRSPDQVDRRFSFRRPGDQSRIGRRRQPGQYLPGGARWRDTGPRQHLDPVRSVDHPWIASASLGTGSE
ncbi:hypothetical protein [Streptomyces tubercidicus]|uniref:hypothetical protein n=1 Tax=Streptomyces tubercidicus TaxID=47759 RepID=UPI00135A8AFD|nr:hypothetical protein [Streptomyces tubercidicus]WAU10703.1 hypothetical protein STRTU_000814 [Streptomyces tubercidicus]